MTDKAGLPEKIDLALAKATEASPMAPMTAVRDLLPMLPRILDVEPLRAESPPPWERARYEWGLGVYDRTPGAVLYVPPAIVNIQLPDSLDDLIASDPVGVREGVAFRLTGELDPEKALAVDKSHFEQQVAYAWQEKYLGALLAGDAQGRIGFEECRRIVRRCCSSTVYGDLKPVVRRKHVRGSLYWRECRDAATGRPEEVVLPPKYRYRWLAAHEAAHAVSERHYGHAGHDACWWGVYRRLLVLAAGAELERVDRALRGEGIWWVEPTGLWREGRP